MPGIVGTVQLGLEQPDNQQHRADLAKMLVPIQTHGAEVSERSCWRPPRRRPATAARTLLVLDTITGSDADRLYTRMGWVRVGDDPRTYAADCRDGGLCARRRCFYKSL